MSEEKKNEVTEETKEEARKLSMEELEQVTGGDDIRCKAMPNIGGDYEEGLY